MGPTGEETGFVYTTYIQASPQRVWQGLTDPVVMQQYWRRRPHFDASELLFAIIDRHRSVRPLVRIDTDHHSHLNASLTSQGVV